MPSCRRARSSGFAASARGPTRRAASNPAGFRRRFRRSIRATEMKPYREWLSSKSYEAMASLGGSFYSNDIRDYYLTPYDLGLRAVREVRPRLHRPAGAREDGGNQRRKKVTLVWNGEDVARVFGSLFGDGTIAKYIDLPLANYATLPYDKVLKGGRRSVSPHTPATPYNERAIVSLAVVNVEAQRAGHAGVGRSGAKRAAGRRSRPSSGTCRSKSARPWRRCRSRTSRALDIVPSRPEVRGRAGEAEWLTSFTGSAAAARGCERRPRADVLREQGNHEDRRHAGRRHDVHQGHGVAVSLPRGVRALLLHHRGRRPGGNAGRHSAGRPGHDDLHPAGAEAPAAREDAALLFRVPGPESLQDAHPRGHAKRI